MKTFDPRNPDFESRVRTSYSRQRVMGLLGASLNRVEPGLVTIELPFREDLTQQHGFLHAGVVATICDSACGYAALSLMAAEASVLSIEYKINLMAPAAGQRFVAEGRVIRPGRTITTTEGRVFAQDQAAGSPAESTTQIATMLATMMTIRDRPDVSE